MIDLARLNSEVLDIDLLQTWHELSRPGENNFLQDLVQIFLHRAPELLTNLSDAVLRGDSTAVAQAAHALKGSSGNIGARALTQLCEAIEFQAPTVALEGPSHPKFQELLKSFNRVKNELRPLTDS